MDTETTLDAGFSSFCANCNMMELDINSNVTSCCHAPIGADVGTNPEEPMTDTPGECCQYMLPSTDESEPEVSECTWSVTEDELELESLECTCTSCPVHTVPASQEPLEGWPKLCQDAGALEAFFSRVLDFLDIKDIKKCRRVCVAWYHGITRSENFSNRFKILQVQNDGVRDWSELLTSDLVQHFNAKNYHFIQCNLTDLDANLFLITTTSKIKTLELERCFLSPATLQLICSDFTNLESLTLSGLSNCIVFGESLFPSTQKPNRLKKLKKLKIGSNFEKSWTRDPAHWNCLNFNLHRQFLADLLATSFALESLTFSGFGSLTASHVIELILTRVRSFLHLTHLYFQNIPSRDLNFEHFHLLGSPFAQGICLRKLALTLYNPLALDSAHQHANFGNAVISNILKTHRLSLEVLHLDRCPVTTAVFETEMPRLHKLSLKSTQVRTAKFGHLLPALQEFKHSCHHSKFNPNLESMNPVVTEEILSPSFWDEATGPHCDRTGGDCDRDAGQRLVMADILENAEHVRNREFDNWRPISAMICLMLPLGYFFVQQAEELPNYASMAYLIVGILVILLITIKTYV